MPKSFYSSGKIILSGEHSVVHGYPAVVTQLPIGVVAEVEETNSQTRNASYISHILKLFSGTFLVDTAGITLTIKSQLTQKSGFGSSAAVANATVQALADHFGIELTKDKQFEIVLEAEKMIHGNPSGVDVAAVVHGGTLVFSKVPTPQWEVLTVATPRNFLLINSGKAEETTGEMITMVTTKMKSDPSISGLLRELGEVTNAWQTEFSTSTRQTFNSNLITQNQELLEKLEVVGEKAKSIIKTIVANGGVAKVTGAGGVKSGSGWLLAYHSNMDELLSLAERYVWETQISTVQ